MLPSQIQLPLCDGEVLAVAVERQSVEGRDHAFKKLGNSWVAIGWWKPAGRISK